MRGGRRRREQVVMSQVLALITYVMPFLIVISTVIAVHELGHFFAGRLCGVKIDRFSLGFGPTLWSRKDRRGVEWRIAAWPLGGYVRFAGDANAAGVPDADDLNALKARIEAEEGPGAEKAYHHFKPVWQRAFIAAAGPLANFILAIGLFAVLFAVFGEPVVPARVHQIEPGSAAEAAGFRSGDLITAIDGRRIASVQDAVTKISLSSDTALAIDVLRDGRKVTLRATPRRTEVADDLMGAQKVGRLGMVLKASPGEARWVRYGPFEAVGRGAQQCWSVITGTVDYIARIFVGKESGDMLGGPLRTASLSGKVVEQAAEAGGPLWLQAANVAVSIINLIAFISVTIGFANLLPIPVLDGGHLLFYAYETVARRPLPARVQEVGYQVGLALLALLMLFATWNDLNRLSVFKILGGLFS